MDMEHCLERYFTKKEIVEGDDQATLCSYDVFCVGAGMKQRRISGKNFEIAVIWSDRLTFDPHGHDEYVLSCNISGNETLVLDGKSMTAAQSCTTLYNPGQVQSGDGTDCLVSVYLEPDFFLKENISSKMLDYDKPIVNDEMLLNQFSKLIGMVFNNASLPDAEEAIFKILDCSTARYTALPEMKIPGRGDWRIARVIDLLLNNLEETPSLDQLAQEVGLNKLVLHRMFVQETGFPPITWQRAKRIEAARVLLKHGTPTAEVAFRTGFADQAHLTRWFGRAYGISPSRFARQYPRSRLHTA